MARVSLVMAVAIALSVLGCAFAASNKHFTVQVAEPARLDEVRRRVKLCIRPWKRVWRHVLSLGEFLLYENIYLNNAYFRCAHDLYCSAVSSPLAAMWLPAPQLLTYLAWKRSALCV